MDPLEGSQAWSTGDQVNGPKLSTYLGERHSHGHACTIRGGRNTRAKPWINMLNHKKVFFMVNYRFIDLPVVQMTFVR